MLLLGLLAIAAQAAVAPPAPRIFLPAPPPPPPPTRVDKGQAASAKANLATYLGDTDYPPEAIRRGEQGTVGFRLSVGTDGTVQACLITASSGSAILDEATCRLMQARAKFTPATDAAGKAVEDAAFALIRWVLPKPVMPIASTLWVTMREDGSLTDCQVEERGGSGPAQTADPTCAGIGQQASQLKDRFAQILFTPTRRTATLRFAMQTLEVSEAEPGLPLDGKVLGRSTHLVAVAADGRVEGCELETKTGLDLVGNPCATIHGFDPARFGNRPASVRMVVTVSLMGGAA